ncbi:MAG: hypothetical protein HYW24_01585 [Candidatus Aenigmarchaeota archaeon]|nr:hypothetical protein [Candidatus Aenigmarchaeota archaeon]
MSSFENLVKEMGSKSNLKEDEILKLVNEKYGEMQNLITKEGALYLVAKEFGVNISENYGNGMTIKNIVSGMKNISFVGRIFKISKINEFKKSNGQTGKVANVFLGDESSHIRLPLWDEQVKLLEEGVISMGDIVRINNAMVRENVFGDVEISLGKFGAIANVEDFVELPPVEELSRRFMTNMPEKTSISDVATGGIFEIKGTIVSIFKGNYLFDVCPMCGTKTENKQCIEHGDVAPSPAFVFSFLIDDGTGDLRCVLFRETAEKFCGVTSGELHELEPDRRYELLNSRMLGNDAMMTGKIKKNMLFNRLEMMVNDFKTINPLEESKRLVDELELMVGD